MSEEYERERQIVHRFLLRHKEEGNYVVCRKMERTGDHQAT
jgi:hypothetical protein